MNTAQNLTWFVLTVRPGMERVAAVAVERLRAEVFLPGERRWVRPARRRRGRGPGRQVQRTFVSFPGYLFAGVPQHLIDGRWWGQVLDLELISGVLMRTRRLDPDSKRPLWVEEPWALPVSWRMGGWLADKENLAGLLEDLPPPDYEFSEGDEVLVTHIAFDRHPGKCVKLTGDVALIAMTFFGSTYEVPVPVDMVAKA